MKQYSERIITLFFMVAIFLLWDIRMGLQQQKQQQEDHFSTRKVQEQEPTLASPRVAFDTMVDQSYRLATRHLEKAGHKNNHHPPQTRQAFDVAKWTHRSDTGGLTDNDRMVLAHLYSQANSVMEYGLGESTKIANHVGVPNYVGIDSDLVWINMVREQVDPRYRFYLADIGATLDWGVPAQKLDKSVLHYQLVPLIVEQQPFDVYLVDGRWRQACMLASFLHASAMMNKNQSFSSSQMNTTTSTTTNHTMHTTIVLVHDCQRDIYHRADHVLSMERVGDKLCLYRRFSNTTDEDLLQLWKLYHEDHS